MARMVVYEKMHLSTDGDIYYDAMEVADVSEEGLRKALGEEREVPMQLMERVRHAWILQGEGKVDEAERAWKDIERKRHVVEDIPYFLSLKDRVLEEKKRVKGRLDELAKSVEKLSVHESAPLKVAYAFEPATNTHVLMSQAYVSAALEELVCLLREFDLVETWNKYAERSVLVEVLGLMHVVCRCELNLPWPVADREVLFSAQASDVLEDTGKYLISIRSERDEATRRSERLQIQLLDGCALAMQPTVSSNGTEVTRCEMELRVRDPRLRWAPAFLVNLVLKVIAPWIFRRVHRQVLPELRDPRSAYAHRLSSRDELYAHLRRRRLRASASGPGSMRPLARVQPPPTRTLTAVYEGKGMGLKGIVPSP